MPSSRENALSKPTQGQTTRKRNKNIGTKYVCIDGGKTVSTKKKSRSKDIKPPRAQKPWQDRVRSLGRINIYHRQAESHPNVATPDEYVRRNQQKNKYQKKYKSRTNPKSKDQVATTMQRVSIAAKAEPMNKTQGRQPPCNGFDTSLCRSRSPRSEINGCPTQTWRRHKDRQKDEYMYILTQRQVMRLACCDWPRDSSQVDPAQATTHAARHHADKPGRQRCG